MANYTNSFYDALHSGTRRSARAIVPLVLQLVQPQRVIDVGCGRGTWLTAFHEHGITDVWGIDGDHVDRQRLEIPPDRFLARDLSQPFRVDGHFDLAVCLEVAEHLPEANAANFIASLARLAPVVLFSAAIPHQGGEHHVNEQWPEYWAGLFRAHGYVPLDCLRCKIWSHPDVDWWYAQNILLYATLERVQSCPELNRVYESGSAAPLRLVHPHRYLEWVEWGLAQQQRNLEVAHSTSQGVSV